MVLLKLVPVTIRSQQTQLFFPHLWFPGLGKLAILLGEVGLTALAEIGAEGAVSIWGAEGFNGSCCS